MNQIKKDNKKKRQWTRGFAIILALLLVLSSFSQLAFAQDDEMPDEAVTQETQAETEDKWASLFEHTKLTGVYADDLVAIAQTQKDY